MSGEPCCLQAQHCLREEHSLRPCSPTVPQSSAQKPGQLLQQLLYALALHRYSAAISQQLCKLQEARSQLLHFVRAGEGCRGLPCCVCWHCNKHICQLGKLQDTRQLLVAFHLCCWLSAVHAMRRCADHLLLEAIGGADAACQGRLLTPCCLRRDMQASVSPGMQPASVASLPG